MIKKPLIICLLIIMSVFSVLAKDKKKDTHKKGKYIKGFGWSLLSEVGTVKPYALYVGTALPYDTNYVKTTRRVGFSFLVLGWDNHFLLKQYGSEKSISLNFYPSIGFGAIEDRFLNVTLPLMICLNKGNVSTYSSKKDIGLTFGLGAEFIKAGLFKVSKDNYSELDGLRPSFLNIIQPCATIGIRYFTPAQHAMEVNVKFGMRNDKVEDKYGKRSSALKSSYNDFWLRFSMIHFIRY